MGHERDREDFVQVRSARFGDAVTAFSKHHEGRSQTLDLWLKQFWRSGTSVGANVEESQSGQSRADFLHKMHIALKEARETRRWLRNALRGGLFPVAIHPLKIRVKETVFGKPRESVLACLVDEQLKLSAQREKLRSQWKEGVPRTKARTDVQFWLLSDAWLLLAEVCQLVRILGKIVGSTKRRQE